MATNSRRRFIAKFNAQHYAVLAKIVRGIEDEEMRKKVAEHFGKAFNERSAVFNYYDWMKATTNG